MRDEGPLDILVVEDSPTDAVLLREALRGSNGRRVHVVSDGAAALEFLKPPESDVDARRPELVLLDLDLPKVSGLDVLRTIRTDPDLRDIPVIVITSSALAEGVLSANRLTAEGCLGKPVDGDGYDALAETIMNHWREHSALPPTP